MTGVKACPFCGLWLDLSDQDTLYPSGMYWRDYGDGLRGYHGFYERQEGDGMVWKIGCATTRGGCGAQLYADSKDEAIAAWNRRVT